MATFLLLTFKYLAWALTVGTAFASTWFFEFTKTDKETGKRSLTLWGRRGITFAALALLCALITTVWTDRDAFVKQSLAAKRIAEEQSLAEKERQEAKEYREKFDAGQIETIRILSILGNNIVSLTDSEKVELGKSVRHLNSIDDYERKYPDLYRKIIDSTTFEDVTSAMQEGLNRAVEERISTDVGCANLPLHGSANTAYRYGHIFLEMTGDSPMISYMVKEDGVDFEILDYRPDVDLRSGYSILFDDDTESSKLSCQTYKSEAGCKDSTSSSQAAVVYKLAQKRLIKEIKTDSKSYKVTSEAAKSIRRLFECVRP